MLQLIHDAAMGVFHDSSVLFLGLLLFLEQVHLCQVVDLQGLQSLGSRSVFLKQPLPELPSLVDVAILLELLNQAVPELVCDYILRM